MFSVWSLYGVAALLPALQKNIGYNVLDLIAKNFYGIFIFYKIIQVHSQTASIEVDTPPPPSAQDDSTTDPTDLHPDAPDASQIQ